MANTMYPGKGLQLTLASSNAREPVWSAMRTPTEAIPNGSYSLGVAVNAGYQTDINIVYDVAPGSATTIEYDTVPTFANAIELDTIPSSSDKVAVWTTNNRLSGFIRVSNTSGQTINEVWAQQTATSFG